MPTQSFNLGGWRKTGAVRLRQGFFGAVLEELVEFRNGAKTWKVSDTFDLSPEYVRPSGPLPPAKND